RPFSSARKELLRDPECRATLGPWPRLGKRVQKGCASRLKERKSGRPGKRASQYFKTGEPLGADLQSNQPRFGDPMVVARNGAIVFAIG
ncbi:MAG: hypothetical protein OXI87_02405, partial [Albidovulum sp.]|nr:hypothetical protein [Albidovulum sp.]